MKYGVFDPLSQAEYDSNVILVAIMIIVITIITTVTMVMIIVTCEKIKCFIIVGSDRTQRWLKTRQLKNGN